MADLFASSCVCVCVGVSVGRGAESVLFDDESFGDFNEIRYHIRDMTLGDVVFCGGVQDTESQSVFF